MGHDGQVQDLAAEGFSWYRALRDSKVFCAATAAALLERASNSLPAAIYSSWLEARNPKAMMLIAIIISIRLNPCILIGQACNFIRHPLI